MPLNPTEVIPLEPTRQAKPFQHVLSEAGFADPDVGPYEIVSKNRPTYEMTHSLTTWIQTNKKGEAPAGALVLVSPETTQGTNGIATFHPNGQHKGHTDNTVVKVFETRTSRQFYAVELDCQMTRVTRAAGPLDRNDRMDLDSLNEALAKAGPGDWTWILEGGAGRFDNPNPPTIVHISQKSETDPAKHQVLCRSKGATLDPRLNHDTAKNNNIEEVNCPECLAWHTSNQLTRLFPSLARLPATAPN